jgi:Na+/phosphate symporter
MEMEIIPIISASIIFVASLIPLYFVLRIRTKQQKILSSFLFIALLTYGIHTVLESVEIINYSLFTKICLIASAFGLIISYSFFQIRHNNAIIGGIFGLAIMISFGIWMIGELFETVVEEEEFTESFEYISNGVMIGFGIFLIIRFFWIRNNIYIESKNIE